MKRNSHRYVASQLLQDILYTTFLGEELDSKGSFCALIKQDNLFRL